MAPACANPMNVFYEEDGAFKVGTVLADNDSTLQVEAAHGKRGNFLCLLALFSVHEAAHPHVHHDTQRQKHEQDGRSAITH